MSRTTRTLGEEVGSWVSTLDHSNDQITWHVLRFQDYLRAEDPDADTCSLLDRIQRLKRQLAPHISRAQLRALINLVNDPAWSDPIAKSAFDLGYSTTASLRNRTRPIPWSWQDHSGLDETTRKRVIQQARAHYGFKG